MGALFRPPPSVFNSASKTALLGPQQTECVSVCWGPNKGRFARGVREAWQIMDRLHRGLATS